MLHRIARNIDIKRLYVILLYKLQVACELYKPIELSTVTCAQLLTTVILSGSLLVQDIGIEAKMWNDSIQI